MIWWLLLITLDMPKQPIFSPEKLREYTADETLNPPVEAQPPVDKGHGGLPLPYHLAIAGANAADYLSTAQALGSGRFQESNPILGQSPLRIGATKGAIAAGGAFLAHKMHDKHPKLAKAAAITQATLPALAAFHNYRLMSKK